MDSRTGSIISGKNIDKRVEPASLTKIATLYLVFKSLESNYISENDFVSFWSAQFPGADKDKNGSLSPAEFPYKNAFEGGDLNKDKQLSKHEHQNIYAGQFRDLDKNKDQKIDSSDK